MTALEIAGITIPSGKIQFSQLMEYNEQEKSGQPFLTMNVMFSQCKCLSLQVNNCFLLVEDICYFNIQGEKKLILEMWTGIAF